MCCNTVNLISVSSHSDIDDTLDVFSYVDTSLLTTPSKPRPRRTISDSRLYTSSSPPPPPPPPPKKHSARGGLLAAIPRKAASMAAARKEKERMKELRRQARDEAKGPPPPLNPLDLVFFCSKGHTLSIQVSDCEFLLYFLFIFLFIFFFMSKLEGAFSSSCGVASI